MAIRTLVLDFDGTCTDVPAVHQKYLDEVLRLFNEKVAPCSAAEWEAALDAVRSHSPEAGWTALGKVPSAPAAADPYILAGEAVAWLNRKANRRMDPNIDLHTPANTIAEAPFRPEMIPVLEGVAALGVKIHFISNSSKKKISDRLDGLLFGRPALRGAIVVDGDAAKFCVQELPWDAPFDPGLRASFERLPTEAARRLSRPIYLRRGSYMNALGNVWNGDANGPRTTLVCGDIWELDLAMPEALGCAVHLIERGAPYNTYAYELDAMTQARRGSSSGDLNGMLAVMKTLV